MGLLEKNRCKNFFNFVQKFDSNNPKTFKDMDVPNIPFQTIIKKFGLEENTNDFIGHALALYTSDEFLKAPALEVISKIKLYMDSIGRYGESPFIYPIYGLGGIPEGFARLCAINQGTFMLNTDIEEILYDDEGKVKGVRKGEEIAKCKMVICDSSYAIKCGLQHKVK